MRTMPICFDSHHQLHRHQMHDLHMHHLQIRRLLFAILLIAAGLTTGTALAQDTQDAQNAQDPHPGTSLYIANCATCHGQDLKGGNGSSLVDGEWAFGDDHEEIVANIEDGIPERGMPPFGQSLTDDQIESIVAYIDQVASGADPFISPAPDSVETLDYAFDVEVVARGLEIPWAVDFIDENTILITERPGRVRIVRDGELVDQPIAGTPEVLHEGQGGLLDVTVDPEYASNGWIYLSYSHALPAEADEEEPAAMTRIVRGRIQDDAWTDQEVVFEAPHDTYLTTRHHYGSRIVFDPDGYLFFSIGDRGVMEDAQDLSLPNGKIHRIHPDGSIPSDNPFVDREGALPSIYSYGHRNPQGVAVHPETGAVWAVEHGPRGGDELNRVERERNYGWPVISYGINYDGTVLTEERVGEGMEQPIRYWRPSIAVSGLAFYSGAQLPYWRNKMLVGALRDQEVRLAQIEPGHVVHEEVILKDAGRVREAQPGPDGSIYVVLNEPDMVVRLVPRMD